jgi:hypothetical protein
MTWTDSTGIPEVMVHTCRSWASTTPGVLRMWRRDLVQVDALGRGLQEHIDASRSGGRACGKITSATRTDASGSAARHPASAITAPAAMTATDPSAPAASRPGHEIAR